MKSLIECPIRNLNRGNSNSKDEGLTMSKPSLMMLELRQKGQKL
jgi:hypothetical protein